MDTLDLKSIYQIILKRWFILVAITLLCTIISTVISFFFLTPIYQSETTLYIGKNLESSGELVYNDLLLGNQLVKDYRELVKSRRIANIVLEELGLEDLTATKLSSKLEVNLKNETRVFQISAQDEDPVLAAKIANKVAEVFQKEVVEIMKVENVQIIDEAEIPVSPIKPNKKINIAIAFVVGLMLGTGVVFLIEYLDNTIKTPEDIKKYLDIPIIGTIPLFTE
ncbi:MAG TPA: lipopolysaccharide biosynthesis protein [Clostridiaceae bacterium]|nr:lipopolysaccharide biosynthesis protein [Clostridiaceae bacterium]